MKREYTYDFRIDNAPMLNPDAGVQFEESKLYASDSGLDESGYMHNIIIRHSVKKWKFTYSTLYAEEYAYIKSLLRGKGNFTFTFKDEEGAEQQTTAYCEQTSVSYWSARRGIYKDLEFEIIEC